MKNPFAAFWPEDFLGRTLVIGSSLCVFFISGCTWTGLSNKEWLVKNSPAKLESLGFSAVYEASQMGDGLPFTNYGSVKCWWVLHRIPDNGITYTCFTYRWGDEIRMYNLHAIDAVKP